MLRIKLFPILLTISLLFSFPVTTLAQDNPASGESVSLKQNETINRDYFAAGNDVTLSGVVNGDAYLAGSNILVEGVVNGSLLTAGANIRVTGKVTENIRVAGGQVIISGEVGGNITALGGMITIDKTAKVTGSLTTAGGQIQLNSPLGKGLTFAAGSVTLNNAVNGDVIGSAENINLNSGTQVNGNFKYWSNKELQLDEGATVSGQTTRQQLPKEFTQNEGKDMAKTGWGFIWFFGRIISFISYLITGLLLLWLLPKLVANTASTITTRPWLSLLIGFITMLVFPPLFIILLLLTFTLPFALLLLGLALIITYLSPIFVALVLGRWMLKQLRPDNTNRYAAFIIGLLALSLIGLIPVLGSLVSFFIIAISLGAILINLKPQPATKP